MALQRYSAHEHDYSHERGFIAIGEVRSEEDGRRASEMLEELGILFELGYGASPVDELRRFFGDWHEGLRLVVQPQDVERAFAAVGSMLVPAEIWLNGTAYLDQRSTEQLVKLLDFRTIWREDILRAAEHVLAERGVVYPPDGGCSRALPVIYVTLILLLGPLCGLILSPIIRGTRRTEEGGTRPRYDEKTRQKLERSVKHGVIAWCVLFAAAVLALKAVIPSQRKSAPPPKPAPAASSSGASS